MGAHRTNMGNRWVSLLLTAAVLLAMPGDFVHAETAGGQARARRMPENPVHHCTKLNDDSDYTDWDYVYFGSYPQTEVTGDALTSEIIGADYDADGDAEVGGEKYRRISKGDTNYDVYFGDGVYRYFKWEPIRWRVLRNEGTTLCLMVNNALDCKFYDVDTRRNTWENCELRNWLNSSFYHMAFSIEEQEAVVEWDVVNEDNPKYGTVGGNNTKDKVYLPSIGEMGNPQYGFCGNITTGSVSRYLQASDYAHVRGISLSTFSQCSGNCNWCWLRSPASTSHYAAFVGGSGYVDLNGSSFFSVGYGVVPVVHINSSSDLWTTKEVDGHEHQFTKKILSWEF